MLPLFTAILDADEQRAARQACPNPPDISPNLRCNYAQLRAVLDASGRHRWSPRMAQERPFGAGLDLVHLRW